MGHGFARVPQTKAGLQSSRGKAVLSDSFEDADLDYSNGLSTMVDNVVVVV